MSLLMLLSSSLASFAQNTSDLYMHVDSLIHNEIQYVYDSTTDRVLEYKWDSTKVARAHFSSFSPNPSPLIILDGLKTDRSELNKYTLDQVSGIVCYKKRDIKMQALYGTSSKNGVVLIVTKRFKRTIK